MAFALNQFGRTPANENVHLKSNLVSMLELMEVLLVAASRANLDRAAVRSGLP